MEWRNAPLRSRITPFTHCDAPVHSLSPDYLARLRFDARQLATLRALGEYRGKQPLYVAQSPEVLSDLRQVALVESTESSNRLEGAVVAAARLKSLVEDYGQVIVDECHHVGAPQIWRSCHGHASHGSICHPKPGFRMCSVTWPMIRTAPALSQQKSRVLSHGAARFWC